MDWDDQDDGVHTPDTPYCADPSCWCHTDVDYHDLATSPYSTDEEITLAYTFYGLTQ